MKHLIVLVGNIGSGKSTYSKQYQEQGYIVVARDQLRYAIGNGTYVFNMKYEPIIWRAEIRMFREFVEMGVNIIVDEVGLSKDHRKRYIPWAKKHNYKVTVIEMPKLSMKESVERRMNNPHGQPDRNLWEQIWTKFDTYYESPSFSEGIDEIIRINRDGTNRTES